MFSQLGSDMLSEIPTSFTTNVELRSLFTFVLITKIPEASGLPFKQVDGIFKEIWFANCGFKSFSTPLNKDMQLRRELLL